MWITNSNLKLAGLKGLLIFQSNVNFKSRLRNGGL